MYQMRFPDTVTIEKRTEKDASHKSTYGAATIVKCNMQYGLQVINDETGSTLVGSAWVAFPPGTDITEGDRVTLPDGSQPPIKSVAPKRNDFSKKIVYIEVYLTRSLPAGSIV